SMTAPSLSPKSIFTRLPGIQACPCCIRSTSSCLVMLAFSFVSSGSGALRAHQPAPICPPMGYETDLKLFIDGVWKSADAGHTVLNPADASPIAEVPYATAADLDEALAASERAWPGWRETDVEKRGAILHKTAQLLRDSADAIG